MATQPYIMTRAHAGRPNHRQVILDAIEAEAAAFDAASKITDARLAALAKREAEIEKIFTLNYARRDRHTVLYGKPLDSHEFYNGTPAYKLSRGLPLDALERAYLKSNRNGSRLPVRGVAS